MQIKSLSMHTEDPKHCMGLDDKSSDTDHINQPPAKDCDYTTAILSKLGSDAGKLAATNLNLAAGTIKSPPRSNNRAKTTSLRSKTSNFTLCLEIYRVIKHRHRRISPFMYLQLNSIHKRNSKKKANSATVVLPPQTEVSWRNNLSTWKTLDNSKSKAKYSCKQLMLWHCGRRQHERYRWAPNAPTANYHAAANDDNHHDHEKRQRQQRKENRRRTKKKKKSKSINSVIMIPPHSITTITITTATLHKHQHHQHHHHHYYHHHQQQQQQTPLVQAPHVGCNRLIGFLSNAKNGPFRNSKAAKALSIKEAVQLQLLTFSLKQAIQVLLKFSPRSSFRRYISVFLSKLYIHIYIYTYFRVTGHLENFKTLCHSSMHLPSIHVCFHDHISVKFQTKSV